MYGAVGGRWRADCSMRDDSWRPIVEGLAVTAGSGMLDGDGLGDCAMETEGATSLSGAHAMR